MIDWENFRQFDQSLNLEAAYLAHYSRYPSYTAVMYVKAITALRPIKSRQLAAIILVNMAGMAE